MSWKPITVGPYRLADTGLEIPGRLVTLKSGKKKRRPPTLADAQETGEFLLDFEKRNQFWIGDWWRDAKERFGEKAYQLVDATGLDLGTLDEYDRVGARIPPKRRLITQGVKFTQHQAVAALDEENQRRVLAKAQVEGLSVAAVRREVRLVKRTPLVEGGAALRGKYRVLVCSPDYNTTTVDELVRLPVEAHMRVNAALFLVHPESARFDIGRVLAAWGFEHRRAFIWDRVVHQRADSYLDERHEHILWAVRGKCPPDNLTPMLDSVFTKRQDADDGEVPEEFRKMVERLYDSGPYLELLATRRMKRSGWTFYGRQLGQAVA